ADTLDDSLLVGVLDEAAGVHGIGAPAIGTAIGSRHPPTVGLVVPHGTGRALLDLPSLELSKRGQQIEEELTDGTARVEAFGDAGQVGAASSELVEDVDRVAGVPCQAVERINDENCVIASSGGNGILQAGPVVGAAAGQILIMKCARHAVTV